MYYYIGREKDAQGSHGCPQSAPCGPDMLRLPRRLLTAYLAAQGIVELTVNERGVVTALSPTPEMDAAHESKSD